MSETTLQLIIQVIIFLGVVLKIIYPLVKAKFTSEQLKTMQVATEIAVFAAEQIFKEVGQGKDKKQMVKEFLLKKWPNMSDDEIDILIEYTGKSFDLFK